MRQVPIVSVHCAIKSWPHLLGCSTSKLKLMTEQFGEFGVQNKRLGQVISKSPQLLLRKPQELLEVGITAILFKLWNILRECIIFHFT